MTADTTSDSMDLDAHAVSPDNANTDASSLYLMQKPNFKMRPSKEKRPKALYLEHWQIS
jgi:hypothetical protein